MEFINKTLGGKGIIPARPARNKKGSTAKVRPELAKLMERLGWKQPD